MVRIMKGTDINYIIEQKGLTLSVSTPVKLLATLDQILLNCFYKGIPYFIDADKCKFCKEHRYRLAKEDVLCKKHYAIDLYHSSDTKLSNVVLRGCEYVMFGRYVKKEEPNCTYVFYITPIHIDTTRFRIFVYPKNIFNINRKIAYTWTCFKKPMMLTFSIKDEPYLLDNTNKSDVRFQKI